MAALTLPELESLALEARTAYHDLVIGKAVASARDQNGEEVRYTQANRSTLANYIADLSAQIDALLGICAAPPIGPMRLLF